MDTSTYSFVKKHMDDEQEKEYALLSEDESWDFIDDIKDDLLDEHYWNKVNKSAEVVV